MIMLLSLKMMKQATIMINGRIILKILFLYVQVIRHEKDTFIPLPGQAKHHGPQRA